jgi:transcriptional regulator with XRE-family HTH domain
MPRIMRDTVDRLYRHDLLQAAQEKTKKNNSMLARETGYSRPTVIAVMNGHSDSLAAVGHIADALSVPRDQLFTKAA